MDVMLSDNMKRLLCRTGFVLLCAIPTFLSVKAILLPPTSHQWSGKFQQQFGVINRIGDVQTVSPQRTDFAELQIGADRFSSRLTIDAASLQTLNDGKTLFIENATGSVSAFWDAMIRITETVSWSGKSDRPVRLHFGRMTFVENEAPDAPTCAWDDLQIAITQKGQLLSATFTSNQHTAAWTEEENVVRMECRTDQQGKTWFVDATGFRIPAWVLKHAVPSVATLNKTAELADARATLVDDNGLWSGEIRGQILDVDLKEVVAARFGNFIQGRALVNIQSAKIANNRIHTMQGDLYSSSGAVGARLLSACTQFLGMELVEPFGQTEEQFTDLRLGFKIRQDQIAIYGMESGAVVNDENGNRMLIAQVGKDWPVTSLIRLVSWPAEYSNSNAAALANHLTMPSILVDPKLQLERTAQQEEVGDGTFFK